MAGYIIKKLGFKVYGKKTSIYVKGSHHRIKIPKTDLDLALFLGLLWGDGWIVNRKIAQKNGSWRIGIVEDDRPLIHHFAYLVKKLFFIKTSYYDKGTYLEAYFHSRIVYEILNKIYGFPDGYKINRLHVPKQILNNKTLILFFLKGLFSTDGKFIFLYKNYPRIGLTSSSLSFINEIKEILIRYNFRPSFSTRRRKEGNNSYEIYLNGKEQAILFSNKIGFIGQKANKLKNFIENINSPVV